MGNVFATLNAVNVNEHTEKKNGLTYLSWAWAWAEIKKAYPNAFYTIYENERGWNYFTDGRTCWVKTGVTIDELEYIEYLPVMDFKNKSISVDSVTSTDVNKSIQRSLTKACARHGLGLYIYAGEDLPETEKAEQPAQTEPAKKTKKAEKPAEPSKQDLITEADLRSKVMAYVNKCNMNAEAVKKLCASYKVNDLSELNAQQCRHYIEFVKKHGGKIDE